MAKGKQFNWEESIEEWRHSGKTQRTYCREKGLSYWTFRDKLKAQSKNGFVRITKEKKTNNILPGHIELIIDKRIQITLVTGYSRDLLKTVLSDLGVVI
jgi:hypothetical protein